MDSLYCFYLYSPGPSYGSPPHFLDYKQLPNQGFSSLFAITELDAKAVHETGTAAQFKGVVWTDTLWIDVDSYETAGTAESRIKEMGYAYVSYDSGGKGAHFGIHLDVAPSHLLPSACKVWVKAHFGDIDGIDTSIYTHLHPFRLRGSIHERTGRRKEMVSQGEGKALTLSYNPEVAQEYTPDSYSITSDTSIFKVGRVMANTKPFSNGERHAALVRLAYALRDDFGATKEVALWWMHQTNLLFEEPKSVQEVEAATRSIY